MAPVAAYIQSNEQSQRSLKYCVLAECDDYCVTLRAYRHFSSLKFNFPSKGVVPVYKIQVQSSFGMSTTSHRVSRGLYINS